MGFLQILELMLKLAPQGITITTEVLNIIKAIETVVGTHTGTSDGQNAIANVAIRALLTPNPATAKT